MAGKLSNRKIYFCWISSSVWFTVWLLEGREGGGGRSEHLGQRLPPLAVLLEEQRW